MLLNWPRENVINPELSWISWSHPSSNYCLDFHGDPNISELRVFSDGNHHMALEETLEAFRSSLGLSSVFYCTTPPKVYLDWMQTNAIEIGNLRLSVTPNIVIGPDDIMEKLLLQQKVCRIKVFAQSMGNSFVVAKGNPKKVRKVRDLLCGDARLFLSNPKTESASHIVYRQTLEQIAASDGLSKNAVAQLIETDGKVMFGELIHHREAPQAIVDGAADVAVVYDHLALRYARIFPEIFERVPLPLGECNVTTRYAVGLVDETSQVARRVFQYFLSDKTKSIYEYHGLQAVGQGNKP